MANTTVTVKQDGTGDYTSITAAEVAADVSSGYYKIEIDDSSTYTEYVNIQGTGGTPTSSNYVWLTASAGNRHGGVAGGNGAFVRNPSSQGGVIDARENFTRIDHLEIEATTTYDVGIGALANNVLISRCIIRGVNQSQWGVRAWVNGNLFIDNCIITGFDLNNILCRGAAVNLYVDHCSIGPGSWTSYIVHSAGIRNESSTAGATTSLYNNIICDTSPYSYSAHSDSTGASGTSNITDSGSSNVYNSSVATSPYNQGSITNWIQASNGWSDVYSGSAYVSVNETNYSTLDYTLTNLTVNPAAGAGTNRIGSEPDSRQDFSTDIAGNPRTTKAGYIDVGAYQVSVAPAGFKYWTGSAWDDANGVQYWNGSAWVDVTGIQYWNGSAWTDPS